MGRAPSPPEGGRSWVGEPPPEPGEEGGGAPRLGVPGPTGAVGIWPAKGCLTGCGGRAGGAAPRDESWPVEPSG